jgi:hypothetical protein
MSRFNRDPPDEVRGRLSSREKFARRQEIDIEDVAISVVAAEDFILSKLAWGKQFGWDVQLHDVRQMVSTVSELDWKYMQKWAAILGIEFVARGEGKVDVC